MPEERKKILIVEDSPTMLRMYRMVLGSRADTELLFAGDGAEGLDRIAQEPDVGLMIVDVNMPRMDGLEFLRRARTELGVEHVPAIVISSEGEEHDRQAALDAGATAYLTKPWTPDELLGALDRITSKSP
jgi:two-component system, chemotaxis family, chemotaxis protein CheY